MGNCDENALGSLTLEPELLRESSISAGLRPLSFTAEHAARVKQLPPIHRDPFDRALVAQALCEPLVLVSLDRHIRQYPALVESFEGA